MTQHQVVPQAGAICLNEGRVVLLSNKSSTRWVIPKGHMEESDSDASFRAGQEAWEEGGITGKLSPDSLGHFFYSKKGRVYRVEVYFMESCELSEKWPEKGMRTRVLVSPKRAAEMVNEPGLKELLGQLPLASTD